MSIKTTAKINILLALAIIVMAVYLQLNDGDPFLGLLFGWILHLKNSIDRYNEVKNEEN